MTEHTHKVSLSCREVQRIIEDLEREEGLRELFGGQVSEALIIAAEGGDIRIEEGGVVDLSDGDVSRFLKILGSIVKNHDVVPGRHGSGERVRIRCDVLKRIIRDLDDSPELQEIFGTPVCHSLVVVAEQGDLRVENGNNVTLSDKQVEDFSRILERVVADNTG